MKQKSLGAILSGGRSQRMGQDKSFVRINGASLLSHVVLRLQKQIDHIIINTNSDDARYLSYHLPIIHDLAQHHYLGPLAGIAACLSYAGAHGYSAIITVAVDTPFFPANLVEKLQINTPHSGVQLAMCGQRPQPTFGYWPVCYLERLVDYLSLDHPNSICQFAHHIDASWIAFDSEHGEDFFNINCKEDISIAQKIAKQRQHLL